MLGFYDTEGCVTHTVLIGRKKCYDCGKFKNDKCHTHCETSDWPSILNACGFCSKTKARQLGFIDNAAYGFTERRVAANMVLYVWNKVRALQEDINSERVMLDHVITRG
jgi:hypothetical protein